MNGYRINRRMLAADWPVFLLIAAELLGGLILLPRLPALVPSHFDAAGQVNGYQSRLGAVLFGPLMALGLYALMLVVPLIDPRRRNYADFGPTLRLFRWAVPLMVLAVSAAVIARALGMRLDASVTARLAVALLFVVLGNSLGRVRPNWFIGVRTPWTLSSDQVWRDTHRVAARCFVVAGLLGVPLAFWTGAGGVIATLVDLVGLGALVPVVYSYLDFRRV